MIRTQLRQAHAMFGNYQPSEFDLRFRIAGIPVRVTPMFWLGTPFSAGVPCGMARPT